jgi:hypothetical protein
MRIPLMVAAGILGGAAVVPSETKIYGASWDGGTNPALTRTDDAVGMTANAGVDSNVVTNDFDTAQIYKDIVDVTDAYGNVFVRIPKIYIEKTVVGAACTWRISRTSFSASCYVPKCFGADGYAYIGKYNASLSGANKLESLSGKYPLISKTIVDFRGYAQAVGSGYQQMDIHAVDLMQVLFIVEFATLHSQSIMAGLTAGAWSVSHVATAAENGANRVVVANATAALFVVGQSIGVGTTLGGNEVFAYRTITSITVVDASNKALNFDGAAANIATGNIVHSLGWISGFSASVTAKSGGPTHLTNGLYPCMYRGIENPWGNVWQFVDGININNNQAWVCQVAADYASNVFASPYEQLGYANKNANGYSSSMGFDSARPYAQLPIGTLGNGSNYYSDYYYQTFGQRIALLGGIWTSGTYAGLFYWRLSDTSSNANLVVSGRLVRKV